MQEPVELEAARGVARERGEEVAIGEHRLARPERRQDLGLDAVTEIDRVEQRVFDRRQRADLLADADQRLDQRRRGPPRRDDGLAALCSQLRSSLRCVVLPEPSGPSKAMSRPRVRVAPRDHLLRSPDCALAAASMAAVGAGVGRRCP